MKLICDLAINYLEYAGQGVATSRPKKSQLNVGKNSKNEIFMVIQSTDNRAGTQYKISGNIVQTFERFASEGKCTIRLKQPSIDISVNKCDPLQLRILLKIIKTGDLPAAGAADSKKLVDSLPRSHKKLKSAELSQKARTELRVTSRRELLSSSFSHLLVKLEIVDLSMSEIPPSITRLMRLQTLNMSGNKLRSLPSTFASDLRQLNLAGNLFGQAHFKSWKFFEIPRIKKNLQNLNLNSNQLHHVPLQICNVKPLIKLELKANNIKRFPPCFGDLSRLRFLDISDNKINVIDSSFQSLKLDQLDISGNPSEDFAPVVIYQPHPKSHMPTLLEISAITVVKYKLDRSELPVTVQEYLSLMNRCRCLQPVWHSAQSIVPLQLNKIAAQIVTDGAEKSFPMAFYDCSDTGGCRRMCQALVARH